jgi:hypothetical protein
MDESIKAITHTGKGQPTGKFSNYRYQNEYLRTLLIVALKSSLKRKIEN